MWHVSQSVDHQYPWLILDPMFAFHTGLSRNMVMTGESNGHQFHRFFTTLGHDPLENGGHSGFSMATSPIA
jgi:hypothetical protein